MNEITSQSEPTPRQLPIVELDGKRFFVDERLQELRSVDERPLRTIRLSSHDMQALAYAIEHGYQKDIIQALVDDLKRDGEL